MSEDVLGEDMYAWQQMRREAMAEMPDHIDMKLNVILPDITALQQAAATLREMFVSLLKAEFTEDQALRFIAYWMVACGQGNNGTESS